MSRRLDLPPANFICLKWGTRYPASYVNRLHRMVLRHFSGALRFYCLTDDATGLDPSVIPLPLRVDGLVGYWNKLALFQPDFHGIEGNLIYLDLDLVITGSIDFLADHPGDFVIIRNWSRRHMWNSSVMRFRVGDYTQVWEEFIKDRSGIMERLNGDQEWLFECLPDASIWPSDRIVSYKKSLASEAFPLLRKLGIRRAALNAPGWMDTRLPDSAAIVVFHGKPDPEDVADAPYGPWKRASFVRRCWK